MGNKLAIKKYIDRETHSKNKLFLDEESDNYLKEMYPKSINNDAESLYINKNLFRRAMQISDDKNYERIFEIFGEKTEKNENIITFDSIKYLYYAFTSDNIKIKFILIGFLIFGNKEYISEDDFNNNIKNFFDKYKKLINPFSNYSKKLLKPDNNKTKSQSNNNKKQDTKDTKDTKDNMIIKRNNFINNYETFENLELINEFIFYKKIPGISKFKFDSKNKNNLNFYCDCAKTRYDNIYSTSIQEDNLDAMKKEYDNITNSSNKALYFKELKKILKRNNIEINLINLAIDYLRKITFKDYCFFQDLKDLLSNLKYDSSLEDKKKFLFKMISTINKNRSKLTYDQIAKYLEIKEEKEEEKNKNEIISEKNTDDMFDGESFLKNEKFNEMINKLGVSLENFGLLPYSEFKVKTKNKKIRKKIIMDLLIREDINNYEKYLETNFDENDYFYAIDINFWNILIDPNADAQDYIDNSKIAEEINIITEEQRYRNIENERQRKIQEEEWKKREENERRKNRGKNNNNNINNNNNNNINTNNEINTVKKEEEIVQSKKANLKPGLKYNKDFIIICGKLFDILKTNYKINYIIKIKKITERITLNQNPNLIQKENETETETDTPKENKEKKEEKKEDKKEEIKDDVLQYDEEEEQNKKKLIEEKLDKFTINKEKGLISKVTRYEHNQKSEDYDKIFLLQVLDFYPVKTYIKTFGVMVREVERVKEKYDLLEKNKLFNEASEKDKRRIIEEQNREKKQIENKKQDYYNRKENLQNKFMRNIISSEEFNTKIKELHEEYSDIFEKKEKTKSDYEVDISLNEFIETFATYMNDLLADSDKGINLKQRYKTYKDIKRKILNDNGEILSGKKFNIYYFLCSSKTLFIPSDNFSFEKDDNNYESVVGIIVDIYNEKGECFYDLLAKKQKEQDLDPKMRLKKKEKEIQKNKAKEITKTKEQIVKPKLTEEQKRLLKEKEKQEKLEREKLEKELKLQQKKMNEEFYKKQKEYEKIMAQREKEFKQKQKEEEKKRKQLKKELEQKMQREKELEKFIRPPYGIDNYGNTCYFNSVNQIFLNLPILQQIFLDPKINSFINKNNKFGHQGKFFEIFKSLYWIKKSQVGEVVPNLKKMVGKLKQDFNNTNQQDANEYLNFLLENLHEEINLHSRKIYIEEKDDIFNHNTLEEQGNISWSSSLRRNASFIDSIFMFQLRSNLKCRKCNTIKYKFENNYMFDLPLSLCKMVTVEINLYKLPFIYKLYYQEINEKFCKYIKENGGDEIPLFKHLWNYYADILTVEEKKDQASILHFSFDLEREKTFSDVFQILRGIKILELEPEKIEEIQKNEEIELYEIKHYTELIAYSNEKRKIIFPEQELDKYVNIEDKIIIDVYEVLNSIGIQQLYQNNNKINSNFNLYSFISLKEKPKNFKEINKKLSQAKIPQNKLKLISLKEKMMYLKDQEINLTKEQLNDEYKYEFVLPIYHYKIMSKGSEYLFRKFSHKKINNFPTQHIILNNINNISAKDLYDYIWNLNKLYIDHPNINANDFWWNKITNKNNSNTPTPEEINLKLCYPFVLRYLEIPEKKNDDNIYYQQIIHCPLCPWYTYCPGCIIDPRDDLSQITSKFGIVVDWCYNFAEDELTSFNLKSLIKDIDSQVISENLPIIDKKQNYQSIKDCFGLFFEEENLEDPLYCHNCRGPENFSKKYSINKLPYVLILSLKRFKYNQTSNFKLRQMITYPLDLELENKKYELYGVINHYGSINSGHYTAIIKNCEKKWIMCNDSNVYEIEEKRVMNSNAYILFYISKESPYNFDYIKMMKSLMNNIEIEDKNNNKKFIIKKDNNFFKYEPVEIKMKMSDNIGYVMEENIEDFSVDENYDIYQDLIKEDQLRIDNLLKKEKENEKQKDENKTPAKNEKKENNTQIYDKKDNKNEIKKENKEKNDKNEIINETKNENEIKENKKEEKGKENIETEETKKNKENNKNEITEIKKEENTNNINENEEKETISTKSESQTDENKETNSLSEINDSKDSIDSIKKEKLPEYYKNFIEIKLEFGKAWIHKSKVEKFVNMEEKEKNVNKK